jgi:hypothetical protein
MDGEQRGGAAKKPLKASGSTGKSYFQGKYAASGLANFASKANKLHSQLPEPVKEKATNRLQIGIQNVTTTAQPAVDEEQPKLRRPQRKLPSYVRCILA